ncbi:MAG TPA: TraB/GumN family protein [Sphingomicrobium sp.]|nr:TraB/GumN family protein [Sphingomicrobium sp.]
MVNLLIAAALASATPVPPPSSTSTAEPALFVVRNAQTTIYIFGTFHALDGKSQWFGRKIRAAFEDSGELVLETVIPEQPTNAPRPAAVLTPLPITPSASFLATTRMAINAGRAQGMQVDNGADMVLRHVAECEGKQVEGLETLQLQINMFNQIPPSSSPPRDIAAPSRIETTTQIESLSKAMADLQSAWKRGDQSVFVKMLSELKAASPKTYQMMFTERNARWADWVRARMQTPGTVFVAVGAGHLAGPDSLLVRLAERGIPSARVN